MFKKGSFIAFFVGVVWASSCTPATYLKSVKRESFQYSAQSKPLISAHRGGGDYAGYPENCIESFEWLAKQMPVIIECDISMTKDSVLMMMHDDALERTTTGSGKVREVNWEYCKTLQLEDNKGTLTPYKIPTLETVLTWGKDKVMFTLDVKRSVPFEKVAALVKKYRAHSYAAIITYNAQDAAKVHRLDPEVMISVTIRNREEYQRHQEAGIPDNRMIAFVGTREPNSELCQFLHQKGIRCILGTLGNLDKMAAARGDQLYGEFVKQGGDILSSDRPLEAWKVVRSL
ncbi:glycerophosphodiester phosphodiesterase family protein [Runella sp. SP2]|uniref:glycerophosphodiester phosphodiesterase family protein n=1 Tax=Runella sp. SP2 TaxID=2268026 RepID=UPI000F07B4E3|nr:glycerophosphodiester phosphodiesterase family protein [Runella sp. SP2]AYQ33687.1 glycerophosphodiester phosphodiesterase [Runella sp. SP2]